MIITFLQILIKKTEKWEHKSDNREKEEKEELV